MSRFPGVFAEIDRRVAGGFPGLPTWGQRKARAAGGLAVSRRSRCPRRHGSRNGRAAGCMAEAPAWASRWANWRRPLPSPGLPVVTSSTRNCVGFGVQHLVPPGDGRSRASTRPASGRSRGRVFQLFRSTQPLRIFRHSPEDRLMAATNSPCRCIAGNRRAVLSATGQYGRTECPGARHGLVDLVVSDRRRPPESPGQTHVVFAAALTVIDSHSVASLEINSRT